MHGGRRLALALLFATFVSGCEDSGSPIVPCKDPQSIRINDYNFLRRQFFFLENAGPDFLDPRPGFYGHRFVNTYPIIGGASEDSLDIFLSLLPHEIEHNSDEYRIDAYVDLMNNGLADDIGVDSLSLKGLTYKQLVRGVDYELIRAHSVPGEIKYLGIELTNALPVDRNLVVRYRAADNLGNVYTIGDYGNYLSEPFTAELICADNSRFEPSKAKDPTWNLMFRNVYSIGVSGVDPDNVRVRIEDIENRDIHAASGISYLRIFGLDRIVNGTGLPGKDGLVDNVPGVVDYERGYLFFPWYEGFNPPEEVVDSFLNDSSDPRETEFDYSQLALCAGLYSQALTVADIEENHRYRIVVEIWTGEGICPLSK